jgi:UDP-GlcNAc:undecaprenyl-phosphate GlcNAc-1-phosphate transferase
MATAWATAFLAAALLAMVGTPLLRRFAIAVDFLDEPAERKSHQTPVPYLGGVAIMVAVTIGLLAGPDLVPRIAVVTLGACVMGAVGLLDDRRTVSARVRLAIQCGAAIAAVSAGIQIHATRVTAIDDVLTVIWIIGITNAFNLLDNMDGLAGGVAAVASIGVFALAALGGQVVVGALAAALTGACVGFLAYNIRPAAIFMGDAGSLFLGFLLAIGVLQLDPALRPPASFVVPLILLAVPILDTTTVTLARLRRGRPVSQGGRDHLSHRLVARGLEPGGAVATLVVAQLFFSVLAVLTGRHMIGLATGVAVSAAGAALLVLVTARARVYDEAVIGLPRTLLAASGAVVAVVLVLTAPAAFALLRARAVLTHGAASARAALTDAANGRRDDAIAGFVRSHGQFASAAHRLDSPLASAGLAVPIVASNLRAARAVTRACLTLTADGARLARAVDPDRFRLRGGQIPLDDVAAVAPDLAHEARQLSAVNERLANIDRAYLVGPIGRAVTQLAAKTRRGARDAQQAARVTSALPGLLGDDGSRRYFLAVQNTAELRATGGFIGNFGEIIADHGAMRLGRFGRINDLNGTDTSERALHAPDDFVRRYGRFDIPHTWQNVNMSPDFPTVARVIADLYPQSGGAAVDGVIAVDSQGLAALLALTGPVTVPSWPEPLTTDNVVRVTLHDEYDHFQDAAPRIEFLGQVAGAVWAAVMTRELPSPQRIGQVLGPALRGNHLLVSSTHDVDNRHLAALGVTGRVAPVRSDGLQFVSQNAAGNKTDYYLRRRLDLDIRLEPIERSGRATDAVVHTTVRARLSNGAPSSGAAREAIGPFNPEFEPGENRAFVSLYTRHDFDRAQLDGTATTLESATELGRRVYSSYVSIPPGGTRTLQVDLSGTAPLDAAGWYALDLGHQPTLVGDDIRIRLSVAPGWRIDDTVGVRRHGRDATGRFVLDRDRTVWVHVERTGIAGWWDRLRHNH